MAVKNLKMKAVRAGMDLSQEKMAELVGVTCQTIGMIEAGKYTPMLTLSVAISNTITMTRADLL